MDIDLTNKESLKALLEAAQAKAIETSDYTELIDLSKAMSKAVADEAKAKADAHKARFTPHVDLINKAIARFVANEAVAKALGELSSLVDGADKRELIIRVPYTNPSTASINPLSYQPPTTKGTRAPRAEGTGGGRGQPLTVDGTMYASASASIKALDPELTSPMNRASIIAHHTAQGRKVEA